MTTERESDRCTGGAENAVFSRAVTDYWLRYGATNESGTTGEHHVVVDDTLPESRSLMLFEPVGRDGTLSLTSALADRLGLTGQTAVSADALARALDVTALKLNGADYLFYLPAQEQALVQSERVSPDTRQLTETNAGAFADFAAQAPADDLDEAFVELDHWLVFGTFVDEQLVSAASMYPWQGTHLADLGVITLPAYRGQGLAKATVRAISAQALRQGYEPQYRCQLDNASSVALARSAGFVQFGTWDVITAATSQS
jgi:RimJ/RimL family protein N-acetyltransferase